MAGRAREANQSGQIPDPIWHLWWEKILWNVFLWFFTFMLKGWVGKSVGRESGKFPIQYDTFGGKNYSAMPSCDSSGLFWIGLQRKRLGRAREENQGGQIPDPMWHLGGKRMSAPKVLGRKKTLQHKNRNWAKVKRKLNEHAKERKGKTALNSISLWHLQSATSLTLCFMTYCVFVSVNPDIICEWWP